MSAGSIRLRLQCDKKKAASQRLLANWLLLLAGGLGFEPRLTESESVVLPLDDPPKEPLRVCLRAAP